MLRLLNALSFRRLIPPFTRSTFLFFKTYSKKNLPNKIAPEVEKANSLKAKHSFFNSSIAGPYIIKSKKISQAHVNQFLLHVVRGQQDEAEFMLKQNAALVLHSGKVTDYSNRTFTDITALRYGRWALDWHMCLMLLKYMSIDEARIQLQQLEDRGTEYGKQFNFQEIISELQIYLDNFETWSCRDLGLQWCVAIGQAQTCLAVHVMNQLCHPQRSFVPLPDFTDPVLSRSLKLINGDNIFPLKSGKAGILGKDFAIFRWNKPAAGIGTMTPCPNAKITAITDLNALIHLRDTRLIQMHDLQTQLGVFPQPRNILS